MNRQCAAHLAAVGLAILAFTGTRSAPLSAQVTHDTLRLMPLPGDSVRLDPNGFLLDPRWRGRPGDIAPPDVEDRCRFRVAVTALEERVLLITGGPCLPVQERAIVSLNETTTTLGLGLICGTGSDGGIVQGHVNWFPVTVRGQLLWDEYSGEDPADNDVNFDLAVGDTNALTTGNPQPHELGGKRRAYHLEMNYVETLKRVVDVPRSSQEGQSWWVALRNSLDHRHAMRRLVNGRLATVTGLFGLDGVHEFQSEIHPIFAMAVLLDAVRTGPSRHMRETWAVMVRDRGNEGNCAAGTLPLKLPGDSIQTFLLDLGQWRGARGAAVSIGRAWHTDSIRVPSASFDTASGRLLIAFPHPRPVVGSPDFVFMGTIFVEWETDGIAPWRERLQDWPISPSVPVRLDSLAAPPEVPVRGEMGPVRGQDDLFALGRPAPAQLWPMTPETLRASSTAPGPASLRAARTAPWIDSLPVLQGCGPGYGALCRSAWDLAIGVNGELQPFAGVRRGTGSSFSFRLDLSEETFRRRCDAVSCTRPSESGWSPRVAVIYGPVAFRAGLIRARPYAVASVGASFLGRGAAVRTGFGGGLRIAPIAERLALFGEFQDVMRPGGYESRWQLYFGAALNLFRAFWE